MNELLLEVATKQLRVTLSFFLPLSCFFSAPSSFFFASALSFVFFFLALVDFEASMVVATGNRLRKQPTLYSTIYPFLTFISLASVEDSPRK